VNQSIDLDQLRELFLTAPESVTTRVLALGVSFLLVAVVLRLVYRGVLREEYTPIWMAAAFGLALVSVRFDLLRLLTRWSGGWTPSSTVFLLGEVFLVVVSLSYAVRLSRAGVQIKNLSQEVALLRVSMDKLEARGTPTD
jgi:hypothetical protein